MQLGLPFPDRVPRRSGAPTPPPAPDPVVVQGAGVPGPGPALPILFRRHRQARRYVLRVDGDGRVRVTIPRGGSRREAIEFAERHRDWIARQRARTPVSVFTPDQKRDLRRRARTELPARLLALADIHGLAVTQVSIRDQRTRWGSCGRNGHICLNWRLLAMPDWVRDYVLVHELMHLRRLDHSPQFWALVAAAFPRYREARSWLRAHGPRLR